MFVSTMPMHACKMKLRHYNQLASIERTIAFLLKTNNQQEQEQEQQQQ